MCVCVFLGKLKHLYVCGDRCVCMCLSGERLKCWYVCVDISVFFYL